jgi:hypothetical protein
VKGRFIHEGIFCAECLRDGMACYPDEDAATLATKYTTDTDRRGEFAAYKRTKHASLQNVPHNLDFNGSEVGTVSRTVVRIEREGRVADEAEFMQQGSISFTSMGAMCTFEAPNEEGDKVKFCVFRDCDGEATRKLRKCKIFTDVEVYAKEKVLDAAHEYRKGQAAARAKLLRDESLSNNRSHLARAGGSGWKEGTLLTFEEAVAKAKAQIEKKRKMVDDKNAAKTKLLHDEGTASEEDSEEGVVETVGAANRGSSLLDQLTGKGKPKAKAKGKAAARGDANKVKGKEKSAKNNRISKMFDQGSNEELSIEGLSEDEAATQANDSDEDSLDSAGSVCSKASRMSSSSRATERASSSEKADIVKVKSKADKVLDKWTAKLNIKAIMKRGNLGRTINQVPLIIRNFVTY